jgi:hypothetical protein
MNGEKRLNDQALQTVDRKENTKRHKPGMWYGTQSLVVRRCPPHSFQVRRKHTNSVTLTGHPRRCPLLASAQSGRVGALPAPLPRVAHATPLTHSRARRATAPTVRGSTSLRLTPTDSFRCVPARGGRSARFVTQMSVTLTRDAFATACGLIERCNRPTACFAVHRCVRGVPDERSPYSSRATPPIRWHSHARNRWGAATVRADHFAVQPRSPRDTLASAPNSHDARPGVPARYRHSYQPFYLPNRLRAGGARPSHAGIARAFQDQAHNSNTNTSTGLKTLNAHHPKRTAHHLFKPH